MTTASAAEMALLDEWVRAKFSMPVRVDRRNTGQLKVNQQTWHHCQKNRSIEAPAMTIGKKKYSRGLATHSISEIVVTLPGPGKVLTAKIGRDQNYMIAAERTDIYFVVEACGKSLYQSKHFYGGEEAVSISVPLNGAAEFTFRVLGQTDFGHGDWADAKVVLENGKTVWLDELPFSGMQADLGTEPPFSFVYGGRPSSELRIGWERRQAGNTITYRDPVTGLEARCEVERFENFPAVEWVLYFRNTGRVDTPILENVQAMDLAVHRAAGEADLTLRTARGSDCAMTDFQPLEQKLKVKEPVRLTGQNGRSSGNFLPFMNLFAPGGGVIFGIGWSGQWTAVVEATSSADVTLRAGMEFLRTKLHPGEEIRSPRMLVMFWKGEPVRGHNLLRRFILDHHTPRPGGKLLQSPITHGNWGMEPVAKHLKKIKNLLKHKVPFDYYWIDAGWYGDCEKMSDWWPQAGNWHINRRLYPKGFRPLSDLLHKNGKGFLLWFDPERVFENSRIDREHPEWTIRLENEPVRALNLGHPGVYRWTLEMLSKMIAEEGIDLYRQDSNIDLLPFWKKNDEPDRVGMTEIRHIENLYALWDELLKRFPNLVIDNCCSGGRRIDLETTSRSVPLWRSDLQCCPWYHPDGSQAQTFGLSYWVPLHSTGARTPSDDYDYRSAASSGYQASLPGIVADDFPFPWLKKIMTEAGVIRDYHYGDYYPLTGYSTGPDVWMAYQLDRTERGDGIVLAYRRDQCPYPILTARLQALDPKARYRVKFGNAKTIKVFSGKVLMDKGLEIRLDQTRSSVMISYNKIR